MPRRGTFIAREMYLLLVSLRSSLLTMLAWGMTSASVCLGVVAPRPMRGLL